MLDSVPRPAGQADEPQTKAVVFRLTPEEHAELEAIAKRKERSMAWVATRIFRRGLEELRREGWVEDAD
jgi:predicted transcriptional regulator